MNTLKVNNLQYKYGSIQVLNDISFEISDGVIGVLGPNGAGKTTTIKLLTTLFAIQHGDIFLNNLNYKKDIKEIRKRIGYLPQDFSTYGNIKGKEFLEIIGSLKLDWDKKKIQNHVDEIISRLNMNEYINRKVKEYSGGMRQKLGFAQVLVGNPSLIVMDEPTAGLDPEQRNNIRELFPIISKNKIVLVTTHIVEDIEYYCNYLLMIKQGKLLYKGSKEDFIKQVDGMLWEANVDTDTYIKLASDNKVLTTFQGDNCTHVKYISDSPLTKDSIKVNINLQDAYIIHSNMKGNEE